MDLRKARGREIARLGSITRLGDVWLVPSLSRIGKRYRVIVTEQKKTCTCPDFLANGRTCKHIHAVIYHVDYPSANLVDPTPDKPEKTKKSYGQNWSLYRLSRREEKPLLMRILANLCDQFNEDEDDAEARGRGRPPIPLGVLAFGACYKVFEGLAADRFAADLAGAYRSGFISHNPHPNSVLNGFRNPDMTQVLLDLIDQTSIPLRDFEQVFAADSSGFGNQRFDRWIDIKDSKKKKQHTWTKVHLMCGVNTHIVTAVVIKDKDASDTKQLPSLVRMTAKNFDMREVCADKAYGSIANYEVIAKHGAQPFIAFKKIHSGLGGKVRSVRESVGGELWKRMYHMFHTFSDEFYAHYHQRSNVESVFSMIKAKFGGVVRSKSETAMLNEVLAKIVCHNICVLIAAMFQRGLDLDALLAPKTRGWNPVVIPGGLSASPVA